MLRRTEMIALPVKRKLLHKCCVICPPPILDIRYGGDILGAHPLSPCAVNNNAKKPTRFYDAIALYESGRRMKSVCRRMRG